MIAEHALTDLNNTLHDLAVILFAIAVAGIALAVLLGSVRRAHRRQARAHTQSGGGARSLHRGSQPPHRRCSGNDDLGRLGRRSTTCWARSRSRSRRSDSWSPTPRTSCARPLATIRTNLEVLAAQPRHAPRGARSPATRPDRRERRARELVEDLLETARESDDGRGLRDGRCSTSSSTRSSSAGASAIRAWRWWRTSSRPWCWAGTRACGAPSATSSTTR